MYGLGLRPQVYIRDKWLALTVSCTTYLNNFINQPLDLHGETFAVQADSGGGYKGFFLLLRDGASTWPTYSIIPSLILTTASVYPILFNSCRTPAAEVCICEFFWHFFSEKPLITEYNALVRLSSFVIVITRFYYFYSLYELFLWLLLLVIMIILLEFF